MKNNKGFTLVELLAVIAILAILVIIALPNVMGMFNQAKQNSFTTELKEVYKVAQQKWITDSMMSTSDQIYTRCKTCTGKSLDLNGRSELDYYIKINKAGNVIDYYATDGTYQFSYTGELLVEDIKNVSQISNINENEVFYIDEDDVSYGLNNNCRYKLSLGDTEADEYCFAPTRDNHRYDDIYYEYTSVEEAENTLLYINTRNVQNSAYLRVYTDSAHTNMIYEFKRSDVYDHVLLFEGNYMKFIDDSLYIDLGQYKPNNLYFEASGINYSKSGVKNVTHTTSGLLFVDDQTLINAVDSSGATHFSRCDDSGDCSGRIYHPVYK